MLLDASYLHVNEHHVTHCKYKYNHILVAALHPWNCPFLCGDLNRHPLHGSLVPSQPPSQMASQSVQPFLQGSRQGVPLLYNESPLFALKIAPSLSNTRFLEPTRAHNQNGISTGCSAVFAGLMTVTGRPMTDQCEANAGSNTHCILNAYLPTVQSTKEAYLSKTWLT